MSPGLRTFWQQPARWMPVALVLLVWMAVAIPSLSSGFLADDWFQVRDRPWSEVLATFSGDWNRGDRGAGGFYRPLVRVSFALDGMLHGQHPMGYHLSNAVLLLALLGGAYRCGIILSGGRRWTTAMLTAWIAASPLMIEPLYWLSGRTDLLTAALLLWSLWWTLRAVESPTWGRTTGALLLFAASLAAKEVAVGGALILPMTVLLLRPMRPWTHMERVLAIGPLVVLFLYALLRRAVIGGIGGYYGSRSAPLEVPAMLENLQAMLSAVLVPELSEMLGRYFPSAGWVWLMFAVMLLLWCRVPRRLLLLLGAVVVALAPMAGIRVSPWDGSRVLVLALVFQSLALGVVASLLLRKLRWAAWPFAFVIGMLLLSGMYRARVVAGDHASWSWHSMALVEESWTHLRTAPPGAVFVAPEPTHRMARPIFTPGLALFLALQSRASLEGYRAEIADGRLMIEGPDMSVEVFPDFASARAHPLARRRIEALPPMRPADGSARAGEAGFWQWTADDPKASRAPEPTFVQTNPTAGLLPGGVASSREQAAWRATPPLEMGWLELELEATGGGPPPRVIAVIPNPAVGDGHPVSIPMDLVFQEGDLRRWRLALPSWSGLTDLVLGFEFSQTGGRFSVSALRASSKPIPDRMFQRKLRRGD